MNKSDSEIFRKTLIQKRVTDLSYNSSIQLTICCLVSHLLRMITIWNIQISTVTKKKAPKALKEIEEKLEILDQ